MAAFGGRAAGKLPRPDGLGGVELQGGAYQRQEITFVPRDAHHLCVPKAILFEITRCPSVAGVALFDGAGEVMARSGQIWIGRPPGAPMPLPLGATQQA